MNEQFNNYNSQFNNQPPLNNGENNPPQLPKRKFFTSNIIDDTNLDDVGGTTSGNFVSWNTNNSVANNNQDTFTNEGNKTGAEGPGLGVFERQPQQTPSAVEMPSLNDGNSVQWSLAGTEANNQVNVAPIPEPVVQTQVVTNASGMALAEPPKEEPLEMPKPASDGIEMLNEINGDVYVDNEPEVLDFSDEKEAKPKNNSIAEKYQEERKFQEDQLSQGNFESLMGNSSGSTFAPGMTKAEEKAPEVPAQPVVQQPQPIQQPQPVQHPTPQPVSQPQPVLNAMPKPDLGIVPTPIVPPQAAAPAIGMAATPIFQAATETLDDGNQAQQQVNPQIQNQKVEAWMTNQPLSGENFKPAQNIDVNSYSGVAENKKIELKKDKKKKKQDTEPVPEEVIKKDEGKIRVDNMASTIVGSKYLQIVMSPFNIAAFFFGPTYMAYRRMPLAAIIVYVIQLFVVFLAPTFAPDEYYMFAQAGATLGMALIIALSVNRMIVANAKFKAKRIVAKYGEDGDKEKATIMAQRMGRPSILMALLFLILSGVVTGLLITTVFKDTKLANIYNIYMDAYQNGGNVEYNGVIIHSDYDVTKAIDLEVPEGFTKVDKMKYTFISEDNGKYNDCTFEIYGVKNFNNGNTFIKKMAEFNKEADEVSTKEINGIEWTNYYTEDSMYKKYYRGFTYNKQAIVFEFQSGKDVTKGVCDQLYVKVMDGIKVKES